LHFLVVPIEILKIGFVGKDDSTPYTLGRGDTQWKEKKIVPPESVSGIVISGICYRCQEIDLPNKL
jgi:hypothetical protein